MGNLVLGGIFGPSWTAMAQVRKNVFAGEWLSSIVDEKVRERLQHALLLVPP